MAPSEARMSGHGGFFLWSTNIEVSMGITMVIQWEYHGISWNGIYITNNIGTLR